MRREMSFDLAFRFRHESEARAVAAEARNRADRDGPGVPQRIEQARARTELAEPVAAPGQVIAFLVGRAAQRVPGLGLLGRQRLPVIEPLGRDFAGVIDPHQPRDVAAAGFVEGAGNRRSGGRTAAFGPGEARPQPCVGHFEQPIEGGQERASHEAYII